MNIRIFKIESNRYLEINNEWKESLKQIDENYKKAIKKIDSLGIDYSVREIELWLMQKEKERKKEKND